MKRAGKEKGKLGDPKKKTTPFGKNPSGRREAFAGKKRRPGGGSELFNGAVTRENPAESRERGPDQGGGEERTGANYKGAASGKKDRSSPSKKQVLRHLKGVDLEEKKGRSKLGDAALREENRSAVGDLKGRPAAAIQGREEHP